MPQSVSVDLVEDLSGCIRIRTIEEARLRRARLEQHVAELDLEECAASETSPNFRYTSFRVGITGMSIRTL